MKKHFGKTKKKSLFMLVDDEDEEVEKLNKWKLSNQLEIAHR